MKKVSFETRVTIFDRRAMMIRDVPLTCLRLLQELFEGWTFHGRENTGDGYGDCDYIASDLASSVLINFENNRITAYYL